MQKNIQQKVTTGVNDAMAKMAPKAAPKEIKKEELKKEVLIENISIE